MKWQQIETAPKGEPGSYKMGPRILGAAVGVGWRYVHIVNWEWHKNGRTGSWKNLRGVWTPTYWMPLPEAPDA